jgi:hypothetical protein
MILSLATSWWRVCVRPWAPVFTSELGGKNNVMTFVGVALGALLGLLVSWVLHQLVGRSHEEFMGLASIWVKSGTPPPLASWAFLVPCGVIVGFYDFEIVLFIVARLLGGKGSFGTQAYAQSLFYAPLAIVQQAFVAAPVLAHPLFALAAVCSLIPTTTSLKAVHGYSMTRTVLTWAAPIVLNVLAVVVVIVVVSRAR